MNTRIETLTRNYLDSLNLSSWNLNDNQRLVQSGWIIFNASSLRRDYSVRGQDKIYNINSAQLQELLKEQIKIYHQENWKETFFAHDSNNASIDDIKIKFFQWLRSEDIYINWVAVKKAPIGENFREILNDIDQVDLATGVSNRKVEGNLDNLPTRQ